jgi:hypothetical protein
LELNLKDVQVGDSPAKFLLPLFTKFLLTTSEWDQAKHIMELLKPLAKATTTLSGSKFPTLNSALPVYITIINHLHNAQNSLYNQSKLIVPASQMIDKINQYFRSALKKPV